MHTCVTVAEQYAFSNSLFNLSIYQIPDKDLEKRRCEQRVDPLTDTLYTKSEYAPDVQGQDEKEKDDEEEEEEEEEEVEEEMIEEEEEVGQNDNDDYGVTVI